MADKENCVRLTSLAAKRAAAAEPEPMAAAEPCKKKKRVVLGEIQNVVENEIEKHKSESKGNVKKEKVKNVVKEERKNSGIDVNDPQMCKAYVSDIFQYLHDLEMDPRRKVLPNYLEQVQTDLTANMRELLIDWLFEVAEEYKVTSDTLYLTVSYIDRFLSTNAITRNNLQLLGVSSMLIASKYEEISPQKVEVFCDITANKYTKSEVVKMEADVLESLRFEMGNPTVKTFLRRFIRIALEDYGVDFFSIIFCVISPKLESCFSRDVCYNLIDFLGYKQFQIVFKALPYELIWLHLSYTKSSFQFQQNFALQLHSGYKAIDLKECVCMLHDLQLRSKGRSTLVAVRKKYEQHEFKCVATLSSPLLVPESFFKGIEND
ncbi:hypothetical protein RD792_012436 [Penstemon davidsonii]|uniref:Uncharacterized protein n=1 Tax=Penstemon davidsonii TaxID=160366 RepID=A0ABR0CXA3_9LAMI|nr:hypothetical protein RD792_012436 [Penstemon davidsonii]